MPEIAASTKPGADIEKRNLRALSLIIIFGIFSTTMAQPQVLGRLPLQFLLKDEVHVTREQMAEFFFWCGLAWYLKPLAGILTDAFPFFGTRRRHYLLFSSVLTALCWVGMAFVPHAYEPLLVGAMILSVFMVMASTVTGAFLVEAGQKLGAVGRLTSVRMLVDSVCVLIRGPAGGFLATLGFVWATGANALVALAVFPIAFVFLTEPRIPRQESAVILQKVGQQLRTIGRSKNLWMALIFIALYYFTPGFSTPLFYKQTDELHFSQQAIGNLGIFAGGFAILAAIIYSQVVKRFSIRVLLFVSILLAALGTLFYLFYSDWTRAVMIDSQSGLIGGFAEIALMDLAARSTPKGCEGLGYSLILSIRNVAVFGADIVGSFLADHKWPFASLVYLNAGTTALVLILLPFLPAALMRSKDAIVTADRANESA